MCDLYREHLPELAAGTLADGARAALEAHLVACPDCRSALAEWQQIGGAVHRRARSRVATMPAYLPPPTEVPTRPRPLWPLRPIPRPALTLLALVLAAVALWQISAGRRGAGGEGRMAVVDSTGPGNRPGGAAAGTDGAGRTGLESSAMAGAATPVRRIGGRAAALSGVPRPEAAPGAAPGPSTTPARLVSTSLAPPPVATAAPSASPQVAPSASPPAEAQDPAASGSDGPGGEATARPTETVEPATATPGTARVAGTVLGRDGLPRAEILILAEPEPPGAGTLWGMSDVEGRYSIDLPPGSWILHAETPAYQLMWHAGKPNPLAAEPITLGPGDAAMVDFHLEPNPAGLVRGRVTDAEGQPVARAAVIAALPDEASPDGARLSSAVFSDADGSFRLAVPPGVYYLAATRSRRAEDLRWWGGDGSFEQADRFGVAADPVQGIELRLSP